MLDTTHASIRSVANEAENFLRLLAPRLLEQLLYLSLQSGGDGDGAAEPQAYREGIKFLDQAGAYLDRTFEKSFLQVSDKLPTDIAFARDRIASSLSAIRKDMPDTLANVDKATISFISEKTRTELQPAVDDLMQTLFEQAVLAEESAAKKARDVDESAIGQIDLIISKINLIAINASVEAARAGEVGRGFAVIAAEIQDLSNQSKGVVERIRKDMGMSKSSSF